MVHQGQGVDGGPGNQGLQAIEGFQALEDPQEGLQGGTVTLLQGAERLDRDSSPLSKVRLLNPAIDAPSLEAVADLGGEFSGR